MSQPDALTTELGRVRRWALIGGVAGLVLCLVGWFFDPAQFFRSYLFAFVFWWGIGISSLGLLLLSRLVGGGWSVVIRRLLEAGTLTLPMLAVLFLPLLLGLRLVYAWEQPGYVPAPGLWFKGLYLNTPAFILRAVLYFAIWSALALAFRRWSREQDASGDPMIAQRMRVLSGPGLVLYMLTVTFAAVDWVMSLEPDWSSTVYGVIFVVGPGLATMALAIIAVAWLSRRSPLADLVTPLHFNDLGNLLLMFVIFWAYISFSQFLVIWSGNLPDENSWYLHRTMGGWQWIILALVALQFVLPFLLLLSRRIKRRAAWIATLAAVVLVANLVYVFWLVMPAFHPEGITLHWLDFAAPLGIGGIWIATALWRLAQLPLVPLHDPAMEQAVHQEAYHHG